LVRRRGKGSYKIYELKPPVLKNQAQKIVENIEEDLLYARDDGVEIEGELCLMEFELVEPVLFLEK